MALPSALVALLALVVALLAMARATPLGAQVPMGPAMPCHDHAEMTRQLAATYDEAPVSLGLQAGGKRLEIFASARTGTWTILSTTPDGEACVVAVGDGWEWLAAPRGSAI